MRQLHTKPFPYYVGIYSLEELVTSDSRVCVINILGAESRKVTPVSHEYSGGNVVAGVQYGREGKLETALGDIPVYPSVRDVMKAGHRFDTGVIYLPPLAVAQAVSELVSSNEELRRIVIVTEKVSTADSRNIRVLCQEFGVDVVGCNCLGVANVWDNVRVGGALGGDDPQLTLRKGSVAIHSNSGNFTTTMAEYLLTEGFGLTTAVSSGKDVYIHFALPEFLYAAQNDPRTKAVALYVEPGGYYEKMALEMIAERKFGFSKPIVVCVTGRWKKDIGRSCGHAGALAGSGDDALSKERWFDDYFGVPCFDPDAPRVSRRGVRVASIQQVPAAMKAVFDAIGEQPDFEPRGDLNLKPWLGDNLLPLPEPLDVPLAEPPEPHAATLREINRQVGAQYLRRSMRNTSGASRLDPDSMVASLHGRSILELSERSVEENVYFSLAKMMPDAKDLPTVNLLLNLFLKLDDGEMDAVLRARANDATPNAALASGLAALGDAPLLARTRRQAALIIDLIRAHGIDEKTAGYPDAFHAAVAESCLHDDPGAPCCPGASTEVTEFLRGEVLRSTKDCTALKVCQAILRQAEAEGRHVRDLQAFLLAAMTVCVFWQPMLLKRMSRRTVEDAAGYLFLIARQYAYAVIDPSTNTAWQRLTGPLLSGLTGSFTVNAFRIAFGRDPEDTDLTEFRYLIGLTLSNGAGTISAKGAKESVSARNHLSMVYVGFLANTGLAHGGNGFEAVRFLLRYFVDSGLDDPDGNASGVDLSALADRAVRDYAEFKDRAKAAGNLRVEPIPCINHPVFKGSAVNIDPREDFVRGKLREAGVGNAFLDFYHHLVKGLYREGVTRNVFCVNIDAVLACMALKLVWGDLAAGTTDERRIADLVFTLFLYGRAVGVTAEIADHRDRGTDLDCRTPLSELEFVL
ncbi:MAG TPA: CoA-binding protein [Candidatus Krumholzibacteria bacterium]|nr:CoA-binding protein [Candidatus Krumholzibacteria bacterium]HRX50651.1 CoA-binding protein [Candidatus Krumholzibacteria bacterium]